MNLTARLLLAASLTAGYPLVRAAAAPSEAVPTGIVYPANAGVLNVRDAKYGAKGDGVTDDTAAIQKALTEGLYSHHVVYVPNGVYLVSDTLKWQNPANAGNNVRAGGRSCNYRARAGRGQSFASRTARPASGTTPLPKP